MGAVLAARLAADQGESIAGLVMLAPAFFLPTSTTLALRSRAECLARWSRELYLYNPGGSDIHDAGRATDSSELHPDAAVGAVEAARSDGGGEPSLPRITQPTLVMHARRDHTCPQRKNLDYVMKHVGSKEKRAIELEESFHVITVDSEKERVAGEVAEFVERFRVAPQKRAAG